MARKTAPAAKKPKPGTAEPVAIAERKTPAHPNSKYTPELGDEICWLISQGSSFRKIAAMEGMPGERTLYDWLVAHDDFAEMFARAREARADWRADRIDLLTANMLAGKIEPQAARYAIEAERWLAAKENPRRYGDRMALDVAQAPLSDLSDDEINNRIARLAGKHGLQIQIDSES